MNDKITVELGREDLINLLIAISFGLGYNQIDNLQKRQLGSFFNDRFTWDMQVLGRTPLSGLLALYQECKGSTP